MTDKDIIDGEFITDEKTTKKEPLAKEIKLAILVALLVVCTILHFAGVI